MASIKVSDYIAEFLVAKRIDTIFGMSGGAILHFVDACYAHPKLNVVFSTNEQFSAFEADGYARRDNCKKPGVCFSTSGPGATNLLTGIATSYFDSIPMVAFTGQVSRPRIRGNMNVRQLGFQETDIISMAAPITKATFQPTTIGDLILQLETAYALSMHGRKGPVLIDLPDDLQRELISDNEDRGVSASFFIQQSADLDRLCASAKEAIVSANSPLLLVGNGARNAKEQLNRFVNEYRIPAVASWAALDLVENPNLFKGVVGTYSPQLNLMFDKCDLLLSVGCRLSNNIIGSIGNEFAAQAAKIIVDVDFGELQKLERIGVFGAQLVCAPAEDFLSRLVDVSESISLRPRDESTSIARTPSFVGTTPSIASDHREGSRYKSIEKLAQEIASAAVEIGSDVYVDTGNTLAWVANALGRMVSRPRLFSSWNNTPMGYALPAAIGGAFQCSKENRRIFCIIGDGGMGVCLPELAVAQFHGLALKVFIIENGGHNIQKQTIETWLNKRYAGVSRDTGLALPNYGGIEAMFGIKTVQMYSDFATSELHRMLRDDSMYIFRVMVDEDARSFPIVPFGRKISEPICP